MITCGRQWRTKNKPCFLAETLFATWLGTALLLLTGLPIQAYAEELKMTELTEKQLKERVAERYQAVFGKLFFKNPVDQAYVPMPALPAQDLKVTGQTDTVWQVTHDPLVGVIVRASVSKTTGLVQFDNVDIAVE